MRFSIKFSRGSPFILLCFLPLIFTACSINATHPDSPANPSFQSQLDHLAKQLSQTQSDLESAISKLVEAKESNAFLKGLCASLGVIGLVVGAGIGSKAKSDAMKKGAGNGSRKQTPSIPSPE